MARKPTIDDIARLAGVSKATVSRVLNHKPDVNPETRERVLSIVQEQGFVPSITASGLAGGQSRLIGVLVPSFTWPFIADVLRGVAEVISSTSYELVLYSINDTLRGSDKRDVIDHILASKLVAGLIAIFPGMQARHVARLHTHGFPVVLVDDQYIPPGVPWIHADNFTGAYTAVKHLIAHGHQRIAHIQGPAGYLCSCERYEGYCRAMQEAGIPVDPELTQTGDFTEVGGQAAARTLFALPSEQRPTAIFSASDQTAFGVLAVAEEYGLTVPGDVALVGFDDIGLSSHVRPALTSVRQPFPEMGQCAIELLLSRLDPRRFPSVNRHLAAPTTMLATSADGNGKVPLEAADGNLAIAPVHIQLATSLVVRASCGDTSEALLVASHDASFSTPGLSS